MENAIGLAKVKKVAPKPKFVAARAVCDMNNLQAVIANRYDVMARYRQSLKSACAGNWPSSKDQVAAHADFKAVKTRQLHKDETDELHAHDKATLEPRAGQKPGARQSLRHAPGNWRRCGTVPPPPASKLL